MPTTCYRADLPVPAQCEGAVIYQALADPEATAKELPSPRRNVERLKGWWKGRQCANRDACPWRLVPLNYSPAFVHCVLSTT